MVTKEIDSTGYAIVNGIDSDNDFISLAKSFGELIPNNRGDVIQILKPHSKDIARPNTFSAKHGLGEFPLHTDTAFWTVPARFLVLRCKGDMRRGTSVVPLTDVLAAWPADLIDASNYSVWQVRNDREGFFCGFFFNHFGERGFRFDSNCMVAQNRAAFYVNEALSYSLQKVKPTWIQWSPGTAVIVANWCAFHARGPAPEVERDRTLERIYVR